jgi:hypothetical protein
VPEPDNSIPSGEQIQASSSSLDGEHFALILGPFNHEEEATALKAVLANTFTRDVILFNEKGLFKLRIPGFTDAQEAEIFSHNAVNEGLKAGSSVIAYKLRNIDTVRFKDAPDTLKATKL